MVKAEALSALQQVSQERALIHSHSLVRLICLSAATTRQKKITGIKNIIHVPLELASST